VPDDRDPPPAPEAWARELRLAQAADARSRRAHWDRLGAEEATRASTIEALARAGHEVRLDLGPGGTHQGRVVELGPDHVRLAAHDRWRYLRLSSIEVITAAGAHDGPPPDRVERSFAEVLARQAGEEVTLVLASGAQRVGRVAAVGVDVLTLAGAEWPTELPAEPVYVSSSAVAAVFGEGSG
jgi:hypothetical protein